MRVFALEVSHGKSQGISILPTMSYYVSVDPSSVSYRLLGRFINLYIVYIRSMRNCHIIFGANKYVKSLNHKFHGQAQLVEMNQC